MTQPHSYDCRAALVTGASRGIGRETALELAARGADVALLARTASALEQLAATIEEDHDVRALALPTDVSAESDVNEAVADAAEAFDGLDIVISNAAVAHERCLEEVDTEEYRRVMRINVDGTFYVTRAVAPYLRESGGNLVMVASLAGKYPMPKFPVYAATKWWIRGFAMSVAGDLGRDGVATTVVNPTSTRTDIGVEAREQSLKEVYEPGEVAEPEDVARQIVHVAAEDSPTTVSELDLFRRDEFTDFF